MSNPEQVDKEWEQLKAVRPDEDAIQRALSAFSATGSSGQGAATTGYTKRQRKEIPGASSFALATAPSGWKEEFRQKCKCGTFSEDDEKAKRHWQGCPNNPNPVQWTCETCGQVVKGARRDNYARHKETCPGA